MSIRILSESEIKQAAHSFEQPPLLFPSPKNLYQRRIQRLRQLAEEHPMADYLHFAADIVESQLDVLTKNPLPSSVDFTEHFSITSEKMPLSIQHWKANKVWIELLQQLLQAIKPKANENMLACIEWLEKASHNELNTLAEKILNQEFSSISSDKSLFIWTALSLYWLQLAQHLPRNAVMESGEDLHLCPICSSSPVASVIHFGSTQGLRYLHCSLCETEWNMVRAKCSNCDQSGKLDYWSIDQEFAAVRAESCGDCHSYLKAMYQEKDPHVEPVADDLASLFLDFELEEKGFGRSGLNPFLFVNE